MRSPLIPGSLESAKSAYPRITMVFVAIVSSRSGEPVISATVEKQQKIDNRCKDSRKNGTMSQKIYSSPKWGLRTCFPREVSQISDNAREN